MGATRTLVVAAATTDSSVHVSRNAGWYGWSWKLTMSSPTTSASRDELDHGVGLARPPGRDEGAELEVVAVVGHRCGTVMAGYR